MTPRPYVCQSLSADALQADLAWQRIYEEAMPPDEREDFHGIIVPSIRSRVSDALRACDPDTGATVGIATVHHLKHPAPGTGFLVYLAADANVRASGVGSTLFRHAIRVSEERRESSVGPAMVWEVDSPGMHGITRDEWQKRMQRIQFFRKNGGMLLDGADAYVQPPISPVYPPVPMRLMAHKGAGGAIPNADRTREIVRAMYTEKYGATSGVAHETLEKLFRTMYGEEL